MDYVLEMYEAFVLLWTVGLGMAAFFALGLYVGYSWWGGK